MSREDRDRWNSRYADKAPPLPADTFPLPLFLPYADQFPRQGLALDIACGSGQVAVWFAGQGMIVTGVDVSPVAIDHARKLAENRNISHRCRFEVLDLDNGLPKSPAMDLLLCHNFRNPDLYPKIMNRLAPGGLLAIVTLSEVGASPGRFRAKPGELETAFAKLEKICSGEADGRAWLLARKS